MTANTIANMKSYTPPVTQKDIWDVKDAPSGDGPDYSNVTTAKGPPSVVSKPAAPAQVHHHTGGDGNQGGGYTGAGTQAPGSAAAGPMSGGYGPWSKAQGGLISLWPR